jgi:hypothetical protein
MTNIFDDHGRIRADIDPTSIPEDRRGAFVALVSAQRACEQAESNEKIADQKVDACVRVHDEALTRIPKQTITSLVKETFGLA